MPAIGAGQLVAWGLAAVLVVVVGVRALGGSRDDGVPIRVDAAGPGAAAAKGGRGGGEAGPATLAAGGPASPGSGSGGPGSGGPDGGGLYVHVAGAVARPGLYRVPPGSRVAAAVDAAGGLARRADPAGVNLAALLQDGQQVLVPARGRAPAGGAGTGPGSAGAPAAGAPAEAKISLSSATVEQLDTLDGIGPTLAARIVEYRDAHGGFRSVDELREVDGIGDKRLASLRDAVRP